MQLELNYLRIWWSGRLFWTQ